MSLIQVILILAVIGVVVYLITSLPMNEQIRTIIKVVAIIAVLLWLLDISGLFNLGHVHLDRR